MKRTRRDPRQDEMPLAVGYREANPQFVRGWSLSRLARNDGDTRHRRATPTDVEHGAHEDEDQDDAQHSRQNRHMAHYQLE